MGERSDNLVTIIAISHDLYWATETEVQLNNFRKVGHTGTIHILVYVEQDFTAKPYWDKLIDRYKEVQFFFYPEDGTKNLCKIYPPYRRPFMLKKHWHLYPELVEKVILYMDSDVLFNQVPDLSPYIADDICYLSATNYIAASYFGNKRKDVYPFKLKAYDQVDILGDLCRIVGVDKQVVIDNELNTGGCQYLLKGIDEQFWADLEQHCIELRMYTQDINREYFPSEEKGFQSWAIGDMCGLLWNLWKRGKQVQCPAYMDFNWSSDSIIEGNQKLFLHNAGITGVWHMVDGKKRKMFCKSDILFRTSRISFFDINRDSWQLDKGYYSYKYLQAVLEVQDPICKTQYLQYD